MRVYLLPDARRKLDLIIQNCDIEVSALGKATKMPGREAFLIHTVRLFEQDCTPGSTQLDPEALVRFLNELLEQGEDPAQWRVWIHSHVDMKCFFSGTDRRTIKGFLGDWWISIVGNQHGDYLCRLDVFQPVHLWQENIPLDVYLPADEAEVQAVKDELSAKVREKALVYDMNYDYSYPVAVYPSDRNWDWPQGSMESEHESDENKD